MAPPGTTSDVKQNPELEALLEDELEKGKEGVNPESETAPRRLRQFRRAFLWAISFVALVHIFLKRILPLLHYQLQQYQDSRVIPIPGGIELGQCANWTQPLLDGDGYSADFHVNTRHALRFVSEGSLSTGEILVTQSKEVTSTNKAKVSVAVKLEDPKFLEYVRVCEVYSPQNFGYLQDPASGVGIFSVPWHPKQKGSFSVSVELPRKSNSTENALTISQFTSAMPDFRHTFKDVEGVFFQRLGVFTDRAVTAQFLFGHRMNVMTSEAPIRGTFNATEFLFLETSNAPIDVNLGLHDVASSTTWMENNEKVRYWQRPVTASLRTSNGLIRASMNLSRRSRTIELARPPLRGLIKKPMINSQNTSCHRKARLSDTINTNEGIFSISTFNKRGSIDIDFGEAPLNHTLYLDAHTSFSNVKVALPTTYEGKWAMKALHPFREIVDTRRSYKDPTGDERNRILWVDREGLFKQEGAVSWGRRVEKTPEGEVQLKSKFGRATLIL
ncbi:hypothetical protein MD484_g2719, partial [Candolleomyces efflorescens]